MQTHENQSSSAVESTSSAHIKRYQVSEPFSDFEVTLEVDHTILTPERAKEINEFRGSPEERIEAENGDEVKAVIRMAGQFIVRMMLESGWGVSFRTRQVDQGHTWSTKFRSEEGWGGEDDTHFGWCGIRVIGADVEAPGFDEFQLEELPNE